jgi:hypothetical protein
MHPFLILFEEAGNEINCMDYGFDGDKFVTAGRDMDIRIYDSRSARVRYQVHLIWS